jgi:hypothetical protein
MSDPSAKPVWPTVLATIGVFGIFLLIVLLARGPAKSPDEIVTAPEEERWRFTDDGRAGRLAEVQGRDRNEARSYRWLDRDAGWVQLPLERAMQLTVEELNAQR